MFTRTLDNLFKSLRSKVVGSTTSATESISAEEEDLLWSSAVLNTDTPNGLVRAAFFVVGKCFCLRGGQEHRQLRLSQLQRLHDPDWYVYHEHSSKNKQGGIQQLRLDHKLMTIVANKAAKERCPVFVLDTYISKLPEEAKKNDLFYCRAVQKFQKMVHGIPLFQLVKTSSKIWSVVSVRRLELLDGKATTAFGLWVLLHYLQPECLSELYNHALDTVLWMP